MFFTMFYFNSISYHIESSQLIYIAQSFERFLFDTWFFLLKEISEWTIIILLVKNFYWLKRRSLSFRPVWKNSHNLTPVKINSHKIIWCFWKKRKIIFIILLNFSWVGTAACVNKNKVFQDQGLIDNKSSNDKITKQKYIK